MLYTLSKLSFFGRLDASLKYCVPISMTMEDYHDDNTVFEQE